MSRSAACFHEIVAGLRRGISLGRLLLAQEAKMLEISTRSTPDPRRRHITSEPEALNHDKKSDQFNDFNAIEANQYYGVLSIALN
jgi:hypothetical protein